MTDKVNTWTKTKYLVQSRMVSKSVETKDVWQRIPKLFDDMYQAIMFRDMYEAFIKRGEFKSRDGSPIDEALNELVAIIVKLVKEDGGHMEIRIVKRTITDEVIEEVERVKLG